MTTTSLTTTVEDWMKSARYIVGCYNVEDMIQIPGMADHVITKNQLHLFDADYAVFKQAAQDGKIEVQVVDEDKLMSKVKS